MENTCWEATILSLGDVFRSPDKDLKEERVGQMRSKWVVGMSLVVVLFLAFAGQALAHSCTELELCLVGDELGVSAYGVELLDRKAIDEFGRLLAVLNNHPRLWCLNPESQVLEIDFVGLVEILGESSHLALGERTAILQLAHLHDGRQVTLVPDGTDSERQLKPPPEPYYETYLVSTGNGEHSVVTPSDTWIRHPGDATYCKTVYHRWTWNLGGGHVDPVVGTIWLEVDVSYGVEETYGASFPVPEGMEGRVCREDRFYDTWAEYDDWYFYPDPDIEGQWRSLYLGRYTATASKFYECVLFLEVRPET